MERWDRDRGGGGWGGGGGGGRGGGIGVGVGVEVGGRCGTVSIIRLGDCLGTKGTMQQRQSRPA